MIKRVSIWLNVFTCAICFFNIWLLTAMRPVWTYINQAVPVPMISFVVVLIILNGAVLLVSLVFLLSIIRRLKAEGVTATVLQNVVPIVFAAALFALKVYMLMEMGSNKHIVFDKMLSELTHAAGLVPLIVIVLLLTVYPRHKLSKNTFFKGVFIFIITLVMFFFIGDFRMVRITRGPFIQAVDDSHVAVIWTTNLKSTAYVEFGSKPDELKKITSSDHGLIDANNTTHKVVIPIKDLKEYVYRVGSTRIKKLDEGEAVFGNTAISSLKTVKNVSEKETISFYVLNDVHGKKKIYERFLSGNNYDFFVLNGDTLDTLENPTSFFKQIAQPIVQYTNGEKPFYFVRGNHEARGGFARELPNSLYLPNGSYYYTFKAGPVFAIVLDAGDGGDISDQSEINYGLVSYKQYREEETEWLKAVCASEDYKKAEFRIAFVHVPLDPYSDNIDEEENVYKREWRNLFNSTGMDLVFSGHTHVPEVIKPDYKKVNFPVLIGGGNEYEDYIAVKTTVSPKEIKVYYEKLDGSIQEVYNIKK